MKKIFIILILGTLTMSYGNFVMPDEREPHKQTWMGFVANDYIWAKRQIPEVKRNLALIAKTIAKYEPVSMLVSPYDKAEAIRLLGGLDRHNFPITLIEQEIRDTQNCY